MQHNNHPLLILVRGIPGSGKTYLAHALRQRLGSERVAIVDPDNTDYESDAYRQHAKTLSAEGVDERLHPYRFTRAQAYRAIEEHKIIIWTQGFTNIDGLNKTIINLQAYAADHGTHLPVVVVEVEVDEATAKARADKREAETGRSVPDEAFVRFINDYKSIAGQEYTVVSVHGKDDINQSTAAVEKALQELDKNKPA